MVAKTHLLPSVSSNCVLFIVKLKKKRTFPLKKRTTDRVIIAFKVALIVTYARGIFIVELTILIFDLIYFLYPNNTITYRLIRQRLYE